MTRAPAVIAGISLLCISATPLLAASWSEADGYLGRLQQYKIKPNESLIEIARRFDLGFNDIADANPGVDPFIPTIGSVVTIPTAWILPAVDHRPAIIINIPELRLYYLPRKRGAKVRTYPLGIGDQGRDTPAGTYTIVEKIANPAWYVPKSIRAERRGLPAVVPPGPDNPMGSHALRLSLRSILIHGTNRPWGIGRRSSHGCLRLYPEDIKELYNLVPKGMRVVILNQPLKVTVRRDAVFLEAHRFQREDLNVARALRLLAERKLLGKADFGKVIQTVKEKRGYPVDVTLRAVPPSSGRQRNQR
jgi:L,D-transpeptidase ErfK/SrfK